MPKKTLYWTLVVMGSLLGAAAGVGPDEAVSNLSAWATALRIPTLADWLASKNADQWGMVIGVGIAAFALGRLISRASLGPSDGASRVALDPPPPDDPDASKRLVSFWRTCARDMLMTLAAYFETLQLDLLFSDGGGLAHDLLNKYVAEKTPTLISVVDRIDGMSLVDQQDAICKVWDHYAEYCKWIGEVAKIHPTDKEENQEYQRWKSKDGQFTQNLSAILSDGRFPIIEAHIGSVSTSDQLGVP